MAGRGGLEGAAHLVLAAGVVQLDPPEAVFRGDAGGLASAAESRVGGVDGEQRRLIYFAEFSGLYPWPVDAGGAVEAFTAQRLRATVGALDGA